jgi:hypothetical protein
MVPNLPANIAAQDRNGQLHWDDAPFTVVANDLITDLLCGYQLADQSIILNTDIVDQAIDLVA